MISRIRGTLLTREPERIEVMTGGGVGYELEIPLSVFEKLPRAGQEVELLTYQVVREDDLMLFGFLQPGERSLFGRLLGASGVGPRLALAMMSTLTPTALVRAITDREVATLVQVPGVGKKTAERIALELGDKLDDLALTAGPSVKGAAAQEAVGALVALGYASSEASAAVRRSIEEDGPEEDAKALIRKALAHAGA
ncbi:MAG: Holliday junction branch migration protein RuvA [Gemmatimonadetes bacterium]|nr:Holliday junction branch migration protein RuvA [Gemmatimonadota bacterium]NIU72887.1 Holliday junction branch migration protein RuvA [Gammaproteobacteria bacterium]NIP82152.1 Holliday junction branch migration protein RuvA [Gemmatimonadota bacterium]NIQ52749.1 Holliday junction branch migration protein RuvA [Gemmatimonadota bacterium]NIX47066.1 Holliday junction branch migration protein RuvA [Gemmatimonadota bacterium]